MTMPDETLFGQTLPRHAPPGEVSTGDPLVDVTVAWLSALLDSASSDVIGAASWWPRAESALVSAAAGCSTGGEATTIAARKLQVDVTRADTDAALVAATRRIDADLAEWQALVDRESVYLIALTRIHRQARKAGRR